MGKPFSQACENNKPFILNVLRRNFADCTHVLEIGSGTGQHAVHFAHHLPHLIWQASDLAENHAGIELWLNEATTENLRPPLTLDVTQSSWPIHQVDGVFSANTAHIMPWEAVVAMIAGIGQILASGGIFCLYGPMNYLGKFTSASNVCFDLWLKEQVSHQGIREFHDINRLALQAGMVLLEDNAMPANNRTLVWQKI